MCMGKQGHILFQEFLGWHFFGGGRGGATRGKEIIDCTK